MNRAQVVIEKGALALSGSAFRAAWYCASRVASGAFLSQGKLESAQNTA
jgi:hypothetical protein